MSVQENRLLLIEPPFHRLFKETYSLHRYPLGMAYLAATARTRTCWQVRAYNADFSPAGGIAQVAYVTGRGFEHYLRNLKNPTAHVWKDIASKIVSFGPRVVGITAKSQNFASACHVARIAKEIHHDTVVVVGGPHASMVGRQILQCPDIDVCVRGEGEITLIELLDAVRTGDTLEDIRGIVYRAGDRIVETPPREFIEDLDTLPFPNDFAPEVLEDHAKYPDAAFSHIFATRGCPFNCSFCGSRNIWGRRVRFRSVDSVVTEIRHLQARGLRVVNFEDDTFGVTKRYIQKLGTALQSRCPGLQWACELHVKLVEEETIAMMRAAGCTWMNIGVESGSNEILDKIRKGITIEEALEACRVITKKGIGLSVFFMVGFPWETEQTLKETARAMKRTRSDVISYSIFTPYPGTEIFEYCKEKGLIADNFDVSLYNHQSPANCFSMYIPHARFRTLVSRLERMVDRKIRLSRLRRSLSWRSMRRLRELGVRKGLERVKAAVLGRE